jgi:hypothetical protein
MISGGERCPVQDEFTLAISPVMLGGGRRLSEGIGRDDKASAPRPRQSSASRAPRCPTGPGYGLLPIRPFHKT